MFDILFIKNFTNKLDYLKINFDFEKLPFYESIKKFQYNINLKNAKCFYLERDKNNINYYNKDYWHTFVFGFVFTNKIYSYDEKENPKIIYAKEVFQLFSKYQQSLVKYIKGSFVILFYNNSTEEIFVISDRHNVLPVYIYNKNGLVIISSSVKAIVHTGLVHTNYDRVSLLQQLIFDYMLDDYTLFKEIKRIKPATIYYISRNGERKQEYFQINNLYHEKLLPRMESLDLLAEQLFENVQLYTSDKKKILVSLTGGFDGRTNVAMLRKEPEEFLCYSYGMPNSRQIQVPELIAKKLKINYQPVYCDSEFEKNYVNLGLKVTEFSNGTAPFTQAVMPYAYSKLNSFSDTILTGLFGSEILRPLHNLGIIINDFSERIFLSNDPKRELNEVINELISLNYFKKSFFEKNDIEEFKEFFLQNYIDKFSSYGKIIRFFLFIIEEGIRKYFSQEIQSERVYVSNRFPYFDQDFIDLIYKTTYAGMYNGFLGKSKYKRRKGQLLYAHIMKKYKPELLNIILDRGYEPGDLIKPFPMNYLFIARGVFKTKKYYKKVGNDTFNTPVWAQGYISYTKESFDNSNFFTDKILDYSILKDDRKLLKMAHFVSIYNYLKNVR